MVLYQICVFGVDRKSIMAARVHNVFSLAEILKITKPISQDIILKVDHLRTIHAMFALN
jgi:hypothetical protein